MARPLPPSIAATVPGIAAASVAIAGAVDERRAPLHLDVDRLAAACAGGRAAPGTIDPDAARRTPSSATRPSHSTLAPTPSWPWPPPTATSQPSASFIGIASASARCRRRAAARPGGAASRAAGRRSPRGGSTARRATRASAPRADAHTTTWPADHDACSSTSPGSSPRARRRLVVVGGSRGCGGAGGSGGRSRAAVASRLSSVSVKSATTWSRSSPGSERTEARSSSASMIKRSSTTSDARSSAWKSATSSAELRPSAIDQIAASSSCRSIIIEWCRVVRGARQPDVLGAREAERTSVRSRGMRAEESLRGTDRARRDHSDDRRPPGRPPIATCPGRAARVGRHSAGERRAIIQRCRRQRRTSGTSSPSGRCSTPTWRRSSTSTPVAASRSPSSTSG